jgi:hypothetical protein
MTASTETPEVDARLSSRIPDFYIVGHAKCGTTALYEALKRHPQVFMPLQKEPWFFARNNPKLTKGGARTIAHTGNRVESLEEYLELFADAEPGQRVGEGSTSYLWSPVAARAIAKARPDARIIAILREPADFLRSLHQQLLVNHTESEKDLGKALTLDQPRREGKQIPRYALWPQAIIYSDRVKYVEQLRRYEEVFPRDQILVLIYDDFRRDNDGTYKEVLRFLGVEAEGYSLGVTETNVSNRRVRSNSVNNLARVLNQGKGPISGALNTAIKRATSREMRQSMMWPVYNRLLYGKPRTPDARVLEDMRRRFKGEVVALSEHLGRDLVTLWGYDDID